MRASNPWHPLDALEALDARRSRDSSNTLHPLDALEALETGSSLRPLRTHCALRTSRPNNALNALRTLDTLNALNTLNALWPNRTLGPNRTLRAGGPGRTGGIGRREVPHHVDHDVRRACDEDTQRPTRRHRRNDASAHNRAGKVAQVIRGWARTDAGPNNQIAIDSVRHSREADGDCSD